MYPKTYGEHLKQATVAGVSERPWTGQTMEELR